MEQSYLVTHLDKCVWNFPLSLINLLGIPNRLIMCSQMKLETTALVAFFKGMASTYFMNCSVAAKIHIWPLEGGLIGPIRSSP